MMSTLPRLNSAIYVLRDLFSYRTTDKHANYLLYGHIFYEVYCFPVNILGMEYYSHVSLGSDYAWDILFMQVC